MKPITADSFFQRIDYQKQISLNSSILVFGTPETLSTLGPIASDFGTIFSTENLISLHDQSEHLDALVSALHYTAVFCFFCSGSFYQQYWLDHAIAPQLSSMPLVEAFRIDVTTLSSTDKDRLNAVGVDKPPCILVYRMGHQVDKILPESPNSVLHQQVSQYMASLRERAASKESSAREEPQRELDDRRKATEKDEETRYRMEVKRKIAEDRAARVRRFAPQ
jgi:hypothetical protein